MDSRILNLVSIDALQYFRVTISYEVELKTFDFTKGTARQLAAAGKQVKLPNFSGTVVSQIVLTLIGLAE